MKMFKPRRRAVKAIVILAPLALLVASANLRQPISAQAALVGRFGAEADLRASHARLKKQLASTHPREFKEALDALAGLDEPGALDVWKAALENSSPQLKKEAWAGYQAARERLERKEVIPQVARIDAPSAEVLRLAAQAELDIAIWSSGDGVTVAAAPPYLIERLTAAGLTATVLYDSVAEWQQARERGDSFARSITPEYQSAAGPKQLVRIAVIDLARKTAPAHGYSDWLGDQENIVLRGDTFLAYLDIFSSVDSAAAIDSYVEERYTRRGYRLAGFYTPEEFERKVDRFFPGKTFSLAPADGERQPGGVRAALAEGKYHSYDETLAEFKSLAETHPDIAQVVNLGTSYEGRKIFALKISKNASLNDPSKPDVLITGCYHAREWISVETPVYFANQLVTNYAADDSIRNFVDHLQIWVVPIVNPDGLVYSQGSPNDANNATRLWRRNRRPLSFGGCVTDVGVDLNRNFSFQWRLRTDSPCSDYCSSDRDCIKDDIGASDDPKSEVYRGSQAESEPEVRAIKSLIDDPNRHFRAQLDYHNFSQLILYPWGYQKFPTDDASTLGRLAKQMSDAVYQVDRKLYRAEQSIDLYATTGSSIDYAYGMSRVPAPFVIEMRPTSGSFNLPESEIPAANQENWAGARTILEWAVGPPILESIQAYSAASDGGFSKLVYSARWVEAGDGSADSRRLVVETQFPGIEPGRLRVRLQFSKPMSASLPAKAALGRDGRTDELTLVAVGNGKGWQKTNYANDTWVGETVIVQDENLTSAWHLVVSATDLFGLGLDALPQTIASYAIGTGKWKNYEDPGGEGSEGGVDMQHALAPTLRGNYPNVFVASPSGGERLAGGDTLTIAWTVPKESGFIPVAQEIFLSVDGGVNYSPIAENLSGGVEKYQLVLPKVSTTGARVQVLAREGSFGNSLIGRSQANFTIGANVGGAVDITVLSSEVLDQNWTDTPSEGPATMTSGASRFILNVKLTNHGNAAIADPFLRIAEISRANVLLTRDARSSSSAGARLTLDAGEDNVLSPGESAQARLTIGLLSKKKFAVSLEMYGVPVGGAISPAAAVKVWNGKPKNR